MHTVIWLGGKPQAFILRMAKETSHACIAGSGTCYNLDIEWRAAELLRSLPNKHIYHKGILNLYIILWMYSLCITSLHYLSNPCNAFIACYNLCLENLTRNHFNLREYTLSFIHSFIHSSSLSYPSPADLSPKDLYKVGLQTTIMYSCGWMDGWTYLGHFMDCYRKQE